MESNVEYSEDLLRAVVEHALAGYPSEVCGVVVRLRDDSLRFKPMQNVADRYHAKDPESFPRTSRDSYLFHPKEQMEVFEASERGDEVVVAIVHSHCDCGAYFSAKDQDDALGGTRDTPLFPFVEYLVVSVRGDGTRMPKADSAKSVSWAKADGRFVEREIPLPP